MKKLFINILFFVTLLNAGIFGTTKGEFSVNQGAANYKIKIDVPPGVAGMEPELAIVYNSLNNKDGYLGKGWSISGLSIITRCPQTKAVDGKNHKFGIKFNKDDRFCLDNKRLINVEGDYAEDGSEYKTEINDYSKIIQTGIYEDNKGPHSFLVKTKSGLKKTYGKYGGNSGDQSAYIVINKQKAFWKLNKIEDTYGNKIEYTYDNNYSSGENYIDYITYANNKIDFIYENRKNPKYLYQGGHIVSITKRLKEIIIKSGSTIVRKYKLKYNDGKIDNLASDMLVSITENVAEGDLKALEFTYGTEDKLYTKTNLKPKTQTRTATYIDINGDGCIDVYSNNDWSAGDCSGHFSSWKAMPDDFKSKNFHNAMVKFADLDGDGDVDIVASIMHVKLNRKEQKQKGVRLETHIYTNNGTGNFKYKTKLSVKDKFYSKKGEEESIYWQVLKLADFDGDGQIDILIGGMENEKAYIYKNNNLSFKKAKTLSVDTNDSRELIVVDLNNDGLADIYEVDKGYDITHFNNGNFSFKKEEKAKIYAEHYDIRFVDLNGDGVVDIYEIDDDKDNVWINDGTGHFKEKYHPDIRANAREIKLADVNGDGFVDVVIGVAKKAKNFDDDSGNDYDYKTDRPLEVWLNNGNGDFKYSGAIELYCLIKNIHFVDIDGNRVPDIIEADSSKKIWMANAKNTLINRFTNDKDEDIKITYKNMADKAVYSKKAPNTKPYNSIENDNIPVTLNIPLVYRVYTLNGIGGYKSFSYMYSDYIVNKLRGSQGFRSIYTYDETPKTDGTKFVSGVFYKQIEKPNGEGFEFTGLPYYTYSGREYKKRTKDEPWGGLDTWGVWLSSEYVEYKNASDSNKVYEPYAYLSRKSTYDPNSKELIKREYNYNYVSNDGHGNVEKQINQIKDYINDITFNTTTVNEYSDDEEKWYLGRLVKSKVTHSKTGEDAIVKESQFAYNNKGILNKEVFNANSSLKLTKTYVYNNYGNKIKECISGYKVNRCSTYKYDSLGKFKISTTDAAGLTTTYAYDARFGTPTKITDANGVVTTIKYDGLGRKVEEKNSLGNKTTWEHVEGKNYIDADYYIYSVGIDSDGKPFVRKYYDALGREVGSYTYTMLTEDTNSYKKRRIVTRKKYNENGLLVEEELPHYQTTESFGLIKTTYDKYDRAIKVTKPGANGKLQTYRASYKNFTKIETAPNGAKKATYKNAKEQTIKITDAYGTTKESSVDYKYDAFGNLTQTIDANGNIIINKYDSAGNKYYTKDPDLGEWNYRYTADGKLLQKWTEAKDGNETLNMTVYTYDSIGRLIKSNNYNKAEYSKDNKNYSYNYKTFKYGESDAKAGYRGKLIQSYASSKLTGKDWNGQKIKYEYDKYGRLISNNRYIYSAAKWFETKTEYDNYNRVKTVTYPNGYKITNHYNKGILEYISDENKTIYKANAFDAFGNVFKATYANEAESYNFTNITGVTTKLYTTIPSLSNGTIVDISYEYDKIGNIVKRDDRSIKDKYITDNFGYDVLNRITSLNVSSNILGSYETSKSYQYDAIGNITYKSDVGDYIYSSNAPHAVVKAGSAKYSYNYMGAMANRDGDKIIYYPNAKTAKIIGKNGNEVKYYYGDDDKRYQKSTDSLDTYYIGKLYEEQEDNTNNIKEIAYIYFGGKLVGTHIQKYTKDIGSKDITNNYFHTDTLGSITAITNDKGEVIQRRSYEPFGAIRAMDYGLNAKDTLKESLRAFTGHEHIKEIPNLINMNARLYDSKLGRFLSADSIIQYPYHSQGLNRYSYIENNPLIAPDPTGHGFFSWLGSVFKSIFNSFKTIISIVVAAVVIVYMPQALASMGGIWVANGGASALAIMVSGAVAGFTSTLIATGSLDLALYAGIGGFISAGVANMIGHSAAFANLKTFGKAMAHGISRAVISTMQGGKALGGFLSGVAGSLLGGIVKGLNNISTYTKTILMSIAGGTASVLGGGKFANGALSSAFIFMFNHEWRVSVSVSGGVGAGGTVEKGYSLIHDSNQPWYKGWHFVKFITIGHGTYLDASASGELNIAWSNANNVNDLRGYSTTSGFSANTTVLPANVSVGYEGSISENGQIVSHNISVGLDSPGGSAAESHIYHNRTFVYDEKEKIWK